ncbi:uncharacterized protein LOC134683406 [Mytilus trossulus]|uniref:uncharacterized protein LOC134683406 n=1 Tax=Mytilus trossulus TaxID=6551 RepID=UPI003006C812
MKNVKQFTPKKPSSTQQVAKKHLKRHVKRLRDREYSRLRQMVPSIAEKEKVSKVTVIEEAVKYIDELHQALMERMQNKGFPNSEGVQTHNIQDFIHTMFPANFLRREPAPSPVLYEKQQKVPSFLLRLNKDRKHL